MKSVQQLLITILKMFLFWILLFDFQRILFSIHNWDKLEGISFWEWLATFFYSIRLDIASAAYLGLLPLLFLIIHYLNPSKWTRWLFRGVLILEVLVCAMIHAGEINAYTEWNHKLTSRVFMHLSNPDEVVRTADYAMTIWFFIYVILEVTFAWRIMNWLFKKSLDGNQWKWYLNYSFGAIFFGLFGSIFFLLARGGWQQIPINIDSAYFSNNHVANDIAVNSVYYFGNSYLLYNKSDIDESLPKIDLARAQRIVDELYDYPSEHDNYILDNKRPNLVFVIMESWAAEAVGCLSDNKGATPNFDALAEEGLLFTNIYSTGHTSEIGNSSIFSGNPGIPGISISLQPEKHRKLRSLNQDVEDWGYSSHYVFSGDLKYGNIGGYFMDHGFQDVVDENDFPNGLERGKLNYYDEDLYDFLLKRISKSQEPFMHCAFTGSTHSPYDHPVSKRKRTWEGEEVNFMNSVIYADECISDFIKKCKKEDWYENTLFVFMADHGHAAPGSTDPNSNRFYRIPLLLWGEPLKKEYRGKRIEKVGSQTDLAATLMYQMGGDLSLYPWSKDLMNPECPQFALHTIIGGYGWVTEKGMLAYHMEHQTYQVNTYTPEDFKIEDERGRAFLKVVYENYKKL